MKQQPLHKLTRAFKTGFSAGATISLMVYGIVRILFYEFTFTALEELINFLEIVLSGGLIVGMAFISFLLLEMGIQFLVTLKISFPSINFKNGDENREAINYPMAEMNTPAL